MHIYVQPMLGVLEMVKGASHKTMTSLLTCTRATNDNIDNSHDSFLIPLDDLPELETGGVG